MEEIFTFKNLDCNLRNNASLEIGNLKTVYYGTESLTNLVAKIWNLLPNKYKELKSLSTSKSRISNWVTDKCPCRMCKNYVANIGFIWSLITKRELSKICWKWFLIFVYCLSYFNVRKPVFFSEYGGIRVDWFGWVGLIAGSEIWRWSLIIFVFRKFC